ncbi:MAG: hypothetical protein WD969_01210 [Paracoccaceae bacterium]
MQTDRAMWIKAIFAREFGFSDVQSNYSRVYAWMANQLGHMTLGMATTFFFVWIADTIGATARLVANWSERPSRANGACEFAIACAANNLLLFIASFVVLAAIAGVIWLGLTDQSDEAARPRAIRRRHRRWLCCGFLALTVAALGWLFLGAIGPNAARATDLLGVAAACLAIGAGVLLLCRDIRYFTFALLAIFGAFWIASSGAGADPEVRRWVALALAALFFVYALHATATGADVPERLGPLERGVQAGVVAILALWFVSGTWHGLEGDWPLAIGAAIGSCALWWVKEFGSDLPNVDREIRTAKGRRPLGILGDAARVEKDYLDDARMDARTDGMFYFAGAWIGAGVLSDTPVMTSSSWSSGSEVLGLLVFLAVFLGIGKTWAYRQQALDLAGLDMASRLAVFYAALRIVAIPADQPLDAPEGGPPLSYLPEPLDTLRDFARGTGDAGFDHLVVIGAQGSGRGPLGRALASEAALADWPTISDQLAFWRREPTKRTGRFVRGAQLLEMMRDIHWREDLAQTPTANLLIDRKTGRVTRKDGEFDAKTHELAPAATVVVIDATLTEAVGAQTLARNLAVAEGQVTVWLVEDDRFDPTAGEASQAEIDAWTPDYRLAAAELAAIRAALTVDGRAPRIGVAFTRRFASTAPR